MVDMSWQDASFLQLESPTAPMHVTYLLLFSIPEGEEATFTRDLKQHFLSFDVSSPPFNYRLKQGKLWGNKPKWEESNAVNIEQHFSRVILPAPGGERELGEYVSTFHTQHLDSRLPLWQMTLIDGMDQNRFGLCLKMHHALADGLRLFKIIRRSLSSSANKKMPPPWAVPLHKDKHDDPHNLQQWGKFFFGMMHKDEPRLRKEKHTFPKPPRCVINGTITGNRRVATQSIPLDRVKALAETANCSINDVVIALCSKALRKHLLEKHELPSKPLVAGIPIALRHNEEREIGNALGGLTVAMGTDVETDWVRLVKIHDATQQAKKFIHMMPNALNQTLSAASLYITKAKQLLNQDLNKSTPLSNLTISNMPGPKEQLYLNGAPLESVYPASVLMPDQRLTIMLISYRNHLHFGLVGCPDHLTSIQKIAENLTISLDELEEALKVGSD